MGRPPAIPLGRSDVVLIRERLKELGRNQAWLAEEIGKHESAISRMLKPKNPTASMETLERVAQLLDVDDLYRLLPQLEFEFEITPEFITEAERALRAELEKMRVDVRKVSARQVTGSVGVQFHGRTPDRHTIERRFLVQGTRKAANPAPSNPAH